MKKFATITTALIVLIMISCKVSKNQLNSLETGLPSAQSTPTGAHHQPHQEEVHLLANTPSPALPAETPQVEPSDQQSEPPEITIPAPAKNPVTHYNSKELDDRVREMAKKLNVDPNTYRMPVGDDGKGTKIFRMIGMHVMVGPDGEEAFLPDEL